MGCANNWLIPPAVLYNNPGITRDEFVELLNQTRTGDGSVSYNIKDWKKFSWDFIGHEDKDCHEGLHGLAQILGLRLGKTFKKIKWKSRDRNGIPLQFPFFWIAPKLINGQWETFYEVDVHTGNRLLEPKIAEDYSYDSVKVNGFFSDDFDNYLIKKILENRILTKEERKNWKERGMNPSPKFFVKIIGSPIIEEKENNRFCSLSSLIRRFPWFDPEFMFDFSQENGIFSGPYELRRHNERKGLRWDQKDGKYYLNIEQLPAVFQYSPLVQSGYTDLIVSAEALKSKAWKIFSYHGYERKRIELFLQAFPDAARAHARAVWDGYLSEHAKRKGMTINELLRFRLLPPNAE